MGNGKLAYGISITREQLFDLLRKTVEKYNIELDKITNAREFTKIDEFFADYEDDPSLYDCECFPDIMKYDQLDVFENGACCGKDKDKPYFIGWESNEDLVYMGARDIGDNSVELNMITDEKKEILNKKLKNYFNQEAKFYLLSAVCGSCH